MAKIGFIFGEMFEDQELRVPYDKLSEAGHEVLLIGEREGAEIAGKKGKEKITIECAVDDVDADDLDALVIPGGYSPDHLRTNDAMVDLVREMDEEGKTIAAVCHAPSILIDADIVDGRRLTSWPSIKADLLNAGAEWVDEQVVEDGNLITSRKPDDLDAFSAAILAALEGSETMPEEEGKNASTANAEREWSEDEDAVRGLAAGEPSH